MKYLNDRDNLKLIIHVIISIIAGFIVSIFSNIFGFLLVIFLCVNVFYQYIKKRENRVSELNQYLKRVNNGNFDYSITQYEEGELAKLYSEINKTTVQLQTMNNNLKLQQVRLEQAVEDIAHQLKTPISSLLLLNELQEKDELVIKSKSQLQRLNYLSESLLKLVRIDASLEEFIISTVELDLMFHNIHILISPNLKGVSLNIDNSVYSIQCDVKKSEEAIINVINNKLRYAKEMITISTSEDSLNVYIRIYDDGACIDIEEIYKVFERFYSGKNRNSQSIGIGLAIAKEYMNAQHIQLFVEDCNTFVFKIPKF